MNDNRFPSFPRRSSGSTTRLSGCVILSLLVFVLNARADGPSGPTTPFNDYNWTNWGVVGGDAVVGYSRDLDLVPVGGNSGYLQTKRAEGAPYFNAGFVVTHLQNAQTSFKFVYGRATAAPILNNPYDGLVVAFGITNGTVTVNASIVEPIASPVNSTHATTPAGVGDSNYLPEEYYLISYGPQGLHVAVYPSLPGEMFGPPVDLIKNLKVGRIPGTEISYPASPYDWSPHFWITGDAANNQNGQGVIILGYGSTSIYTVNSQTISGHVTSGGVGIPGVTVTVGTNTFTTDANGFYQSDVRPVEEGPLGVYCTYPGVKFSPGYQSGYLGQNVDFVAATSAAPTLTGPKQVTAGVGTIWPVAFKVADDLGLAQITLAATSSDQTMLTNTALSIRQPDSNGHAFLLVDTSKFHGAFAVVTITATDGQTNITSLPVTVNSATWTGSALQFTSAADAVAVSSPALAGNSFTIEAWVQQLATGNNQYILSQGAPSISLEMLFGFENNATFIFGSGDYLTVPMSIKDGGWHHLAGTFNASTRARTIYLDGRSVASDKSAFSYQGTGPLYLGAFPPVAPAFFSGTVDEVKIWGEERSPANVLEDMNSVAVPSGNLLSYFRLDDLASLPLNGQGPVATNILDGVTQISYGAPALNWTDGKANQLSYYLPGLDKHENALQFNGVSDVVSVQAAKYDITNAITVEAWINLREVITNSFRTIIGHNQIGTYSLLIEPVSDSVDFNIISGGNRFSVSGPSVPTNTWVHLAGTYDPFAGPVSGSIKLYYNGVLQSSVSASGPIDSTPTARLNIGGWAGYAHGFFPGIIDEVRGWTNALAANQIVATMTGESVSGAAPVAYFPFNENGGSLTTDAADSTVHAINYPAWVAGVPKEINFTYSSPNQFQRLPANSFGSSKLFLTNFVGPQSGSLNFSKIQDNNVSYSPTTYFSGTDRFTYQSSDGTNLSAVQTVIITVPSSHYTPGVGSQWSLRFDGQSGSYVDTRDVNLVDSSFTVEAWVKRTPLQAFQPVLSQGAPGSNQCLTFGFNGTNTFTFAFFSDDLVTSPSYPDTNWHHWAGTFDSGTRQRNLYRDGLLVASDTATANYEGSGRISVGRSPAWNTFFQGNIDEVRVWSKVRLQSEIANNMNTALRGDEDGLASYYRFDEGAGVKAIDSASGHEIGTLVNGPVWDSSSDNPAFSTVIVPENGGTGSPGANIFLSAIDFDTYTSLTNITIQNLSRIQQLGSFTGSGANWHFTPITYQLGQIQIVYFATSVAGKKSGSFTNYFSIQQVNQPPIVSDILDQVVEEGDSLKPVAFTFFDVDTPLSLLRISARSSKPTLVPATNIVFALNGTNGTILITPTPGEIGQTTINVDVSDGQAVTTSSFTLQVQSPLAYQVQDVGLPLGKNASRGTAINDAGHLTGYASSSTNGSDAVGIFYSGSGSSANLSVLGGLGGATTFPGVLNSNDQVAGAAQVANGQVHAFFYDAVSQTNLDLGLLVGGTNSFITGLNSGLLAAGYGGLPGGGVAAISSQLGVSSYTTTQTNVAVSIYGTLVPVVTIVTNYLYAPGPLVSLSPSLPAGVSSVVRGINSSNQIAGYTFQGNHTNAFFTSNGTNVFIQLLPGGSYSVATAINDAGSVVGYGDSTNGTSVVFLYQNGQLLNLGDMLGAGSAQPSAINQFGQIVGVAQSTNGDSRGFIYDSGQGFDLNDLLPDDLQAAWTIIEARGINLSGQIAASAWNNGALHAVILQPATVIGRRVLRPTQSAPVYPEIELVQSRAGDTAQNAFYWSDFEGKLFALRPVTALVHWHVSTAVTDNDRVTTAVFNVWPKKPNIHVSSAPVQLQPADPAFEYAYFDMPYNEVNGAQVETVSRVFNAPNNGYTVLQFLHNKGQPVNPQLQTTYFDVVRTVNWNDPRYLADHIPWFIGTAITNSNHDDYPGLNGYVYFPVANYDGAGDSRAYDRPTRTGQIIPVNNDTNRGQSDLVVVWYAVNEIGVAWPGYPARYTLFWPTNASEIVIASLKGSDTSGTLDASIYQNLLIYNQPDPTLPGFNPNEEHALLAPGSNGQAVYALRDDLNGRIRPYKASEPFVLLKYRDGNTKQWSIRPYHVIETNAQFSFTYSAVAGNSIQPPLPLSILPLPQSPSNYVSAGPYFQDYNNVIYASAAGPMGLNTNVEVRYYYPLQPGFYYDLNGTGTNAVPDGTPIAWLGLRTNGIEAVPHPLIFDVRWPSDVPTVQVGQTLTSARNGLPGVLNMASLSIVYDSASAETGDPTISLAKLFDPFSPRTVSGFSQNFLADIRNQTDDRGRTVFPDLSFPLFTRLYSDPTQPNTLSFQGYYDASGVGDPILLPNVMSERERDRIFNLVPNTSSDFANWTNLVTSLYFLTRNPNQVDLFPVDGQPDQDLRLGLTTNGTGGVVLQQFEGVQQALTAGLAGVPPPLTNAGTALQMTGAGWVAAPDLDGLADLTISVWALISPTNTGSLFTNASSASGVFYVQPLPGSQLFNIANGGPATNFIPYAFDTNWHFYTVRRSIADGELRVYVDGQLINGGIIDNSHVPAQNLGLTTISALKIGDHFSGALDDFQVWNTARTASDIFGTMHKRLLGQENGLVAIWRFDDYPNLSNGGALILTNGAIVLDGSDSHFPAVVNGAPNASSLVPSTAPTGIEPRFVTLVENNDSDLPGLPVQLHLVRVDNGPYPGEMKVLQPQNVFDQRLTLRHNNDFGGEPSQVEFQWFYKPDSANFDKTLFPDPDHLNMNGWIPFPDSGFGVNFITTGEAGQSGLIVMSDNWFIMRYRGYNVDGQTNWSPWIGDPSGGPMLAEGWVKRVVDGLNPFDARTTDFRDNASSTLVSMISQAGQRYEGDVALNASGDNLNSLGLIEAYQTVLNRAKSLSVNGTPAVDYDPANNALLLAAGKISDLYMLLGNEAFADAADPTIGITTDSATYGNLASTIFAFQNQLASQLEEEVTLLRGRDDQAEGVNTAPVYNRLFWNFTSGDGEVAYQQVYNITDQNGDGIIDAKDAKIMYPQGHGDAWGHYLTATTVYNDLLRNTNFTWVPRTESVLVLGQPVQVGYEHERKFAVAAAAKAQTGAQIVNLTYREFYVADPAGQWQGYYDTVPNRAWGVAEWARRAGQAALFDWAVGNAILPAVDPDPTHTGVQKIDRTTVQELGQIAAESDSTQAQIDQADSGLNPVGVATGAVSFDLDPALFNNPLGRQTHFEQIYDRANKAMANALVTFNAANQLTASLRRSQDTQTDFQNNVQAQEQDYKNRMIEIFGYPYKGDIAPGQAYPTGYDGPDLVRYMYVNVPDISGNNLNPDSSFTAYFTKLKNAGDNNNYYFDDVNLVATNTVSYGASTNAQVALAVQFPFSSSEYAFPASSTMGQRRAQGTLQEALGDVLQHQIRLEQASARHDDSLATAQDKMDYLALQYNVDAADITIVDTATSTLKTMSESILEAKAAADATSVLAKKADDMSKATADALPKSVGLANDLTGFGRAFAYAAGMVSSGTWKVASAVFSATAAGISAGADMVKATRDQQLQATNQLLVIQQEINDLQQSVRDELTARLEMEAAGEALNQSIAHYTTLLADGQRLIGERTLFRQKTAASVSQNRYRDMAFRIFRNDALQKYQAQLDLAGRYVYLAASAYDYELNLLGADNRSGQKFFEDIIKQRSLGEMVNGVPVVGRLGLANSLAQLRENFVILKPQFGLNNPQTETDRFSLRTEFQRFLPAGVIGTNGMADNSKWSLYLTNAIVTNLWDLPEFRRYCRPFADEVAGPQPGLVLRFSTRIIFGQNLFGWPIGPADHSYDSSQFATKIMSAGVWFTGYDATQLSATPRVYLVPVGDDVLRSPNGNNFTTRQWRVVDQTLPVPFPIGATDLQKPGWIPVNDTLGGSFADIRRHSMLRAFIDSPSFDANNFTPDSRLIGRSVWNTQWMLIVPGGALLASPTDPNAGLNAFINTVQDVKINFQTYSYSGN